jgi:two-component system sensor histidine kinase KdpD
MENQRPDPDELLRSIQQQDPTGARGKLRIYFGANAGVGKTWAMLSAAQRELKAGKDVLIGVVETHGRCETAALLAGLDQLPLRDVSYRHRVLKEFDLDAALERRPRLLLVDELAHSNVEGSRHPKRWQDVEELLEAGIDVWSALNVQHLESLNGTVGAITGIRVHETVPDTVLDGADEIIMVDVTPDELTARLAAGKVYLPHQAERAAQNFFRKGNLIALREIALRRTAEHVEDDVRNWRSQQSHAKRRVEQSGGAQSGDAEGGMPVWNTSGAILACVGPQDGAEQAVRAAARLAGQLNVRWHAAYVETPRLQRLDAARRDGILAVLKLAEELGAATAVLTGADPAGALVAQAQTLNCAMLVVGRPRPALMARLLGTPTMTRRLAQLAPTLDLVEVGLAASSRRLGKNIQVPQEEDTEGSWRGPWTGYAWSAAACVAITLLATPLHAVFDLANIVMLYLFGTVLIALKFGRGPAALAAVLNVAAFDYYFVEPRLSFAVSDVQYLLTFAVMLVVGLLTGQLTAGLTFQARIAASRERRAQSLFELTRDLSAALQASQVAELGEAAVRRNFGGEALVLVTRLDGELDMPTSLPSGFDASVADWALRNGQSAGLATSTLAAQPWHYVPLTAPMRLRGVLALCPREPRWLLIPEQMQQLDTLARQIAIALERVHYVEIAQQAVVDVESERLRNALLAAISHDVRTPLTALMGLAESLERTGLDAGQQETAQAISDEARQLSALVNNLLDMARLQSGAVTLRKDWHSMEEVVGSAIRAARHALGPGVVETALPSDLPLVEFDAALIERVLVNLLENAAKYGAGPIAVGAESTESEIIITVRDHGAGLPAALKGREQELFDKFTRGEAESAKPGVGLGLAISKAVVVAHQGSISAANAPGGGAVFTVRLPRRPPPAEPVEPGELA